MPDTGYNWGAWAFVADADPSDWSAEALADNATETSGTAISLDGKSRSYAARRPGGALRAGGSSGPGGSHPVPIRAALRRPTRGKIRPAKRPSLEHPFSGFLKTGTDRDYSAHKEPAPTKIESRLDVTADLGVERGGSAGQAASPASAVTRPPTRRRFPRPGP